MKSDVKGVSYNKQQRVWVSCTPGKKVLFRGTSMEDAETARRLYDVNRANNFQSRYTKKATVMFRHPVTFTHMTDGGVLEPFYEI